MKELKDIVGGGMGGGNCKSAKCAAANVSMPGTHIGLTSSLIFQVR